MDNLDISAKALSAQISSSLNQDTQWPMPPICSGQWRTLNNAHSSRLLVRLVAEQSARKDVIIPLEHKVVSIRATPLACYPDCLLVEALCHVPFSSDLAICTLFFSSTFIRPLDYSSAFIHETLNEGGLLSIKSKTEALAYVHFFCGIVSGNKGRFILINDDHLVDLSMVDSKQLEELQKINVTDEKDFYSINCTVFYDDSICKAKFMLDDEGNIEMVDDELINNIQVSSPKEIIQGYFRYAEQS